MIGIKSAFTLAIVLLLFCILKEAYGNGSRYPKYINNTEKFRNMAVSDDYVYIGGKQSIIQLNSTSLNVLSTYVMPGNPVNLILGIVNMVNTDNLLICNQEGSENEHIYSIRCEVHAIQKGFKSVVGPRGVLFVKHSNVKHLITDVFNQKIVLLVSEYCLRKTSQPGTSDPCIAIDGLELSDLVAIDQNYFVQYENHEDNRVSFLSVFEWEEFIFFLFFNDSCSRLGKMCTNRASGQSYKNSFENTPIQCLHNGIRFTHATYAVKWKDNIYVSFTNGTDSVICKYDFTYIATTFAESRKQSLECSNHYRNDIFVEEKTDFNWCYCNSTNVCVIQNKTEGHSGKCEDAPIQMIPCSEEKGEFCNSGLFGSVEGQLSITSYSVVSYYTNADVGDIAKLEIQQLNAYAILYIGTIKGFIGKVLINDYQTKGQFLGEFQIVSFFSPVLDIKVKDDNVFVMTKEMIINIAEKDVCPTGSCEKCMKSNNPTCGWDIFSGRCTGVKSASDLWLPSVGKKCLKVQSLEQYRLDKDTVEEEIKFRFKFDPPVVPNDQSLKCNTSGRQEPSFVFYKNNAFTCNISVSTDTKVSIRTTSNGEVKFAEVKVDTYMCSSSSSCSTCVKYKRCDWCITSFSCINADDSCDRKVNAMQETGCPRIDIPKLFIRQGSDSTYLTGSNLPVTISIGMTCVIENESNGQNTKYDAVVLNSTHVKCNFGSENKKSPGIGDYSIRLAKSIGNSKKDLIFLDGSAELEVYTCSTFDCGLCRYKNSLGYQCYWCKSECAQNSCDEQQECPKGTLAIDKVDPNRGPRNGGTRITFDIDIKSEYLISSGLSVTVDGVNCTDIEITQKPKSSISCTTGDARTDSTQSGVIVNFFGSISNALAFEYVNQERIFITRIHPSRGIQSGGRKITISGENLGFSEYDIKFCTNSSINRICVDCRPHKDAKNSKELDKIRCSIKGAAFVGNLTYLEVTIDKNTILTRSIQFIILENPEVDEPSEKDSTVFKSGGSNIIVKGKGFNEVDFIGFAGVAQACRILNTTTTKRQAECKAPPYVPSSFDRRRKRAVGQTTYLVFDNYQTSYTIYYAEDPVIYDLPQDIEFEDGSQPLLIEGDRLTAGATKEDYTISIGLDGQCFITDFNDKNITCSPPKAAPRTNLSDENTVFVIVKVGGFEKNIGTITYTIALNILAIVVGVLAGLLVVAIVGGGAAYWKSKKNRKADQEKFALDLINLEKKISEDSKAEFAEAQMTIKNIKSDLVTTRVPYLDYQSYAFHQLFPNKDMETHPLLREPVVTDDRKKTTKEAMDMLNKLLTNKLFLKSLVKTLDNSVKKLTMQDKAHFSSLLSVALVGNMKLFYQLVICLLEETIKSASNKKQHKQLFRRFESIAQRLTVNWLQLTLYDHLQKHNGMQLFMLYKAAQTVIEKGPIDAVTNHSRNTLAEESLLKTRVEFQTMKLNIDLNGTSDVKIPVEVLDCDTVSQVKHKCCTAIYKNKPASEIPSINDLELEWHAGRGGKLVLQDIDNISDRSNGMVRLNTLKHYLVKDGSDMALMYKEVDDEPQDIYENCHHNQTSPDSVKLLMPSDSVDNSDQNRWHLSNLTDEEKSNKDHEIGEIFLNRLFQTKLILKEYIDSAFGSITDPECLSVPVRYFLCQMDKLGKEVGADSGLLQTWKSQCYATRVWASLISKPQILFDVDVPSHVEPCMDILKQVVIESFTQGAQSVTKESSSQKLLFCNDIPEYRKQVHHFFVSVEDASDGEFWSSLEQISSMQNTQLQFSKQAVLDEIYKFISKHQNEILEDFEEQNEAKDMQFGSKLEAIIEKMEGC